MEQVAACRSLARPAKPFSGPSEVTVFNPAVFMATDGPHSECIKSEVGPPMYLS